MVCVLERLHLAHERARVARAHARRNLEPPALAPIGEPKAEPETRRPVRVLPCPLDRPEASPTAARVPRARPRRNNGLLLVVRRARARACEGGA